jgi:flagellar motor switch protein FliG
MTDARDNLRKAAVLIASLDDEAADRLLDQLPAEAADVLRRMLATIEEVAPEEQSAAIDEFLRHASPQPAASVRAVELEPSLARRLSSDRREPAAELPPAGPRFRALLEATTARVAPLLAHEHPQTIALVLSHLPTPRAAELLAAWPEELQTNVAHRLVDLRETDPDVLRDVERGLESRLVEQSRGESARRERLTWVASMLDAVSPDARRRIVGELAGSDVVAVVQVGPPAPAEAPVWQSCPDADLVRALAVVTPRVAALALAGAEPAQAERLQRSLPRKLRRQLPRPHELGPLRLIDIDAAQQQVLSAARGAIPRALAA